MSGKIHDIVFFSKKYFFEKKVFAKTKNRIYWGE